MSIDSDVDPSEVSTAKRKPSRSWLLIDAAGNSTMLNVDSYAIIRRVHIYACDLRVFESSISSPLSIRTREGAIVLNLEHIKVIITADEVLLREPLNENVIPVAKEFERRLGVENRERRGQPDGKEDSGAEDDAEKDESPFEFRALEVALEAICSFLAARTTELEKSGYPALNELASKISNRNFGKVHKLKISMTKLTVRVQKVKDELQLWLEDDDDLGDLCLSRKIATTSSPVSDSDEQINSYPTSPTIGAKISRAKSHLVRSATVRGDDQNDVEEVEMLLEAHYMQIDRTLNKLAELREYLDDTEDYINFQLASSRNKLIEFEVIITAGSVCISVYSLIVGILSTNIPFSWNTKEHMFKWVVSATATLCAIFFVIIISYARYKKLVGN